MCCPDLAVAKQLKLEGKKSMLWPGSTEKLLGCQISEDFNWKEHILIGEQSLVKQLTGRVNGSCLISDSTKTQTRLIVANGIVMS